MHICGLGSPRISSMKLSVNALIAVGLEIPHRSDAGMK
jgi:hypothetical protein